MIKLQNLRKTYSTKSEGDVYALRDVNLTFPDKGLCVILGPSGCGKTTMLNILGGLEPKYEGDYYFSGKKLSTEKDFADFRKNYVSFVFQDFNLIEDLDVKENLSLGVNFGKANADIAIENVLKKVDLEDYGYRFPQELSGGEQQRVAVARALLKDSKVLLADEPTGNLDSENSEETYKLLKEISRDKLVIVVSHDENLSKRYADYTVRLNSGEVVDSDLPVIAEEEVILQEKKIDAISNKIAGQMAWYELTRKKVRSVMTILVIVICLTVFAVSLPCLLYNKADPRSQLIYDSNYQRFEISDVNYNKLQQMEASGIQYAIADKQGNLMFESKAAAEANGIRFYESDKMQELTSYNYYISDGLLRELFYAEDISGHALIDGQEVTLSFGEYKLTDVIGQKLYAVGYDKTCAGIFYSPFEVTNNTLSSLDDYDAVANYENKFYGGIITCSVTGKSRVDQYVHIKQGDKDVSLTSNCQIVGSLNVPKSGAIYIVDNLGNLTQKPQQQEKDLSNNLQDGEIYLNLEVYNKFFGAHYTANDIFYINRSDNNRAATLRHIPEHLGEEVELELVNYSSGNVQIGKFVVRGVVVTEGVRYDDKYVLYVGGHEAFSKCSLYLHIFNAWITVDSVTNLRAFIRECQDKYYVSVVTPIDELLKGFEKNIIGSLTDALTIIVVVMGILAIGLIAVLIVGQVLSRKREIGIFKALGAKNADVAKIYFFEALIIAAIISVLTVLLSVLLNYVLNILLSLGYEYSVTWIVYNWYNAPITVASIFTLVLLGVLIPLLFIRRVSVIDAIRQGK